MNLLEENLTEKAQKGLLRKKELRSHIKRSLRRSFVDERQLKRIMPK